jgi:hypothetical protein
VENEECITVMGVSYESLALAQPTPYALPLAKFSPDPKAFDFWWRLLYYTFGLPSPYEFPPVPDLRDSEVLARYFSAAKEMASSACLVYEARVDVHVERDDAEGAVETVGSEFPPTELIRGFLALFRQFYTPDELASYSKTRAILMKAAREASDADAATRLSMLTTWGRAEGKLRAYSLRSLVGKRLKEEGRWGGGVPEGLSPTTLISAFASGDLIHWGDRRGEISRWEADQFYGPWNRIQLLEGMAGLAHFYMGYAVIVAACIGRIEEIQG